MSRVLAFVALLALGAACADETLDAVPPPAAPARVEPRRALWVLAEGSYRALESLEKVERLLDDAERLGATDLFVQVYRGGRSWFPSQHADASPHAGLPRASDGRDSLRVLIDGAHARGVHVHAWFNALSLASNRDAPLLRAVGRDAVHVDRRGRSLADYPEFDVPKPDRTWLQLETPGLWLDPATPGVIEYLERTLDDLVAAAPDLDGLHLDFIRHPFALPIVPASRFEVGLDFGYGEPARAAFRAASGEPFGRGDAWDDFRRDRVSEVVERLGARVPRTWERSAAVLPYADRAYLTAMQDWHRWLEEGWLDFAVAMAYTRDTRLLRYVAHGLVGGVAGRRVWIGVGTWLFEDDPAGAQAQIDVARAASPAGIALFSHDALAGERDTLAALRLGPG